VHARVLYLLKRVRRALARGRELRAVRALIQQSASFVPACGAAEGARSGMDRYPAGPEVTKMRGNRHVVRRDETSRCVR